MKRVVTACVLSALALLAVPRSASAGGWAVTTLDPLPAFEPEQPALVGFTIRQHGVTPVALDDVAVVLHPETGPVQRFLAQPQGPVGHYVVEVVVPAGTYRWEVIQGWFGPQDLGPLAVGEATAAVRAPAPAEDGRWPVVVRYGLLGLTVAAAIVFVTSMAWPSRRRTATGSTT